jgi:hypothetical protein
MNTVLRWARRHVAALLLVASPAIGGQLLPLAHPCPVESPWVTGSVAEDPHAGHGHAPRDATAPSPPSEQHNHAECTCIGACAAPVALDAPRTLISARAAFSAPVAQRSWFPVERLDAPVRPHDRLPPQTAPPTA